MAPHQSTIKIVEQSGHAIAQTHILYVPAAKKQNRLRNRHIFKPDVIG